MNELVYVFAALFISAASFFCGVRLSDRYHEQKEREIRNALQKQFVRLKAGVDSDDPVQPYVAPEPEKKYSVSHEFIRRLRTNGSATEAVR